MALSLTSGCGWKVSWRNFLWCCNICLEWVGKNIKPLSSDNLCQGWHWNHWNWSSAPSANFSCWLRAANTHSSTEDANLLPSFLNRARDEPLWQAKDLCYESKGLINIRHSFVSLLPVRDMLVPSFVWQWKVRSVGWVSNYSLHITSSVCGSSVATIVYIDVNQCHTVVTMETLTFFSYAWHCLLSEVYWITTKVALLYSYFL